MENTENRKLVDRLRESRYDLEETKDAGSPRAIDSPKVILRPKLASEADQLSAKNLYPGFLSHRDPYVR